MSRSFFSILLVWSLFASPVAGSPGASGDAVMVTGGADTTVGDVMVETTMVAFPHDIVETHSNRSAKLTFKGNVFTLLGNSKLHFKTGDSAELLSGGIVVASSTRYTIASACFMVQPQENRNTRYSIVPHEGKTYVRSEAGDLKVSSKTSKQEVLVGTEKTAVIRGCGTPSAKLELASDSGRLYQAVFGAAVSGGVAVLCTLPAGGKQDMSSDQRRACRP